MKITKRLISGLLAALMLICLLPVTAFASCKCVQEDSEKFSLSFNPYGGAENDLDTIAWYERDGQYYLFLPADCDPTCLTVYFTTDDTVSVDGNTLVSGEATDAFSNTGCYTVICGDAQYPLTVMVSENLPAMYIETESGSLDYIHANKEHKEKADIRIYEDGKLKLDAALKQIKGRGNATWLDYDKKPYNIKFEEKTKVLGMEKAKKWSLLASASDPSIVRNPIAWYVANGLDIDFSSDYRIVDLYINGDYLGNYIICESVEVGKNRVNIFDLTGATEDVNDPDIALEEYPVGGTAKNGSVPYFGEYPSAKWINIPNDPDDISGGYLLECELPDRYLYETSGFITSRNQSVVIKEPEYASRAQVEYISAYWQEAEDAIWSESGYNSLGKHYSDYFDIDSLVNMYILFEYSANGDGGKTSTYFYKDQGKKIVAAPAWDFDHSFDEDPKLWVANRQSYNAAQTNFATTDCSTIFNKLFRHQDFRELVNARWDEVKDIIAGTDVIDFINGLADEIETSAVMNGIRWNNFSTKEEFWARVAVATSYIPGRYEWLNLGFSDDAAHIYYDLNGGIGSYSDYNIYRIGDTAVVMNPLRPGDNGRIAISRSIGKLFVGWNTEVDGSGRSYQPGDTIELDGFTTLYAQWRDTFHINKHFNEIFELAISKIKPAVFRIADCCLRLDHKYSIMKKVEQYFNW